MKRIFTLIFVLTMVNFVVGQKNILDNPRINQKENITITKSAGEISGEITTETQYAPDVTMYVYFTLSVTSLDFEYGDYVELTFPTGLTPLSGSDAIGDEFYNGIDGQTISWGDDDNYYGGIVPPVDIEFWVQVSIDADVTGEQDVDYFVSGDEYGAAPNEFDGVVTIYEVPDSPDLIPEIIGYVAEYYTVPLEQAVFAPEGRVKNTGFELTEATDFNLTVGDSYDEDMPITVPMGTGVTEDFMFPALSDLDLGTVTFSYTADASDDANPGNGTVEREIEIDETRLSRNNGDIAGAIGVGSPGGMLGNVFYVAAEDIITGVEFYLQAPAIGDIISAAVYEFDGAPGDLIATTMDLIVTAQNSYYTAIFPNEVTLSAGYYLIVLVEGENNINAVYTSDDFTEGTAWAYFNNQWNDLGSLGYPHTYVLDAIFGEYEPPLFDISLEALTMTAYTLAGEVDVTGTIRNMSGVDLTSIDIEYTVDGGTAVSESFSGLSVGPLETYDFEFSTPANLTELGAYDFVVTIDNANGEGPDGNQDNDELSTTTNVVEFIPAKMVVGEEATGTWCGWCTRGHVYMEYMAENYPDTWVGIAVHNYDPMVVPEYDEGIGPWIGGYPSGLVDRNGETDPLYFEDAYLERIVEIAPAEMMIENKSIDNGVLTFDVTGNFIAQVSDFRFNAVLVEDHVTGTGSDWDQANYYSGGGYGPMGGYEDLPDPVPAEDMVYHDVARALLGGWDGVDGSLPATVNAGETHSYEFSVMLDSEWDLNHLEIVGMLINQTTGIIENACVDNAVITNVASIDASTNVSVFPNPATDELRISTEENANVYIYSISGQLMMQKEIVSGTSLMDITGLNNGTYLVKVISNNQTSTSKVNILK